MHPVMVPLSLPLNVPGFSLTEFFLEIQTKPYFLFIFLVPALLIFFYFIILRINAHRRGIDGEPDLKQEKEEFKIPDDYINLEMDFVQKKDYDHFENNLEDSSRKIIILSRSFNRKARKYKRMKYRRTFTASERRKDKLSKEMQEEFKELIKIYSSIQKATVDLDLNRVKEE